MLAMDIMHPRKGVRMVRLFIRDWPDEIHTKLKVEAVRRGVGLREILLEAVKEWLKAGKGKK